jgi:Chaperone of endosialidase
MKMKRYLVLALPLILCVTAVGPNVKAVSPLPDGGYPGGNTAEGQNALLGLTTGFYNTAVGIYSLLSLTTGNFNTANGAGTLLANTADENTAIGAGALLSNTTGTANGANGAFALFSNTTGGFNTADGAFALNKNTVGGGNTASGYQALFNHITGNANTANGANALFSDLSGQANTATGQGALFSNTTGGFNTANGLGALTNNVTGNDNTGVGAGALSGNTTGSDNIALGQGAGANLTTGNNNIDIGVLVTGNPGEANTIRIGGQGTQTATFIAGISGATVPGGVSVIIDANGHLGTIVSSQSFKEEVKPMDDASKAILALKPVTFRYKKELDPERVPQFGLVAEEVEKVNPDLIARDAKGEVYTVRYEAVNAMLLNEFLKEHRAFIEEQQKVEQQQKEIDALKADLKEQRSLIQKVSDKVELNSSTSQVATNK